MQKHKDEIMVNTLIELLRRREDNLDLIPLTGELSQKRVNKEEMESEKTEKMSCFLKNEKKILPHRESKGSCSTPGLGNSIFKSMRYIQHTFLEKDSDC